MWAVNIGMGRESKGRGGGVIREGGGVNRLNSNFSERLDLFRGEKKRKKRVYFSKSVPGMQIQAALRAALKGCGEP